LTKNHIFFHTQDLHSAAAQRFNTAIAFRDVSAVDLAPAKRLLTPDCVQVVAKRHNYLFAVSSRRAELYNALRHLSDVTMQRLARANNEIEPIKSLQADLGDQSKPFVTPSSPTVFTNSAKFPLGNGSASESSLNTQLRRLSMATDAFPVSGTNTTTLMFFLCFMRFKQRLERVGSRPRCKQSHGQSSSWTIKSEIPSFKICFIYPTPSVFWKFITAISRAALLPMALTATTALAAYLFPEIS
jgi:hypothetical protein